MFFYFFFFNIILKHVILSNIEFVLFDVAFVKADNDTYLSKVPNTTADLHLF